MDEHPATIDLGGVDPDAAPEDVTQVASTEAKAGESAPAGEDAPKPKRKRKSVAPKQPQKPAILTARDELLAARRRARATKRVGWELFRDDIKRGRLISVIGLAIILVAGITLVTSPDYLVRSVTVLNSRSLTADQAISMSGVLGSNIFMVNALAVEERLQQAPFVKSVQVQTELPNHVVITIEERQPSVVWVLPDNTPYLISDDGLVISRASTLEGYVVVYDYDIEPGTLNLGDALERKDVIETAQELFMRLKPVAGLNISQMEYRIAGGLTVVTDTGHRVLFGDAENLDEKMRICAALVKDLEARGQQWRKLDLRSPERVAVSG